MKYFLIVSVTLVFLGITGIVSAEESTNCHFGDNSTSLDKIFERDLAVKAFTDKHQNATRNVILEEKYSSDGKLSLTVGYNGTKEVLSIKFTQNENGCYRPKTYHYSYDDGTTNTTIRNTLGNFTEIINLIKSDNKSIRDFYPDNCEFVDIERTITDGKVYGICKEADAPVITILVDAYSDGTLEVNIPIEMVYVLNSKDCVPSNDFFVFSTEGEIPHKITPSDIGNLVKIELKEGANRIEIAGSYIIPDPSPAQYCGIVEGYDKKYLPPLDQIGRDMKPTAVRCNEGLVLIQRYDASPACVKPETKEKLIERGWTESSITVTYEYVIEKDGVTYGSQYEISGGIVDEIFYKEQHNSLVISLDESKNGFIQILIQTGLLHSVGQMPFTYIVIIDGEEVTFEQLSPILLKIPFEKGTKQIEIVGTEM